MKKENKDLLDFPRMLFTKAQEKQTGFQNRLNDRRYENPGYKSGAPKKKW